MSSMLPYAWMRCFLWIWIPLLGDTSAYASKMTKIRITLFGQPCVLSGPIQSVDSNALRIIHSISPEQLPLVETASQAHSALEMLNKVKGVPSFLEDYIRNLKNYLKKEITFFSGMEKAIKEKKPQELLEAVQPHAKGRSLKKLKRIAQGISSKKKDPTLIYNLIEAHREIIGPHPEEEFHRAIEKANVSYRCSFEAPDKKDDSDES